MNGYSTRRIKGERTLPSHLNVSGHSLIRKTGKCVVKHKRVLTLRQVNVDVGDGNLFRVVVGSHSMTIAPVFETISVQNKTLNIVAASAFRTESANDICSRTANSEIPILSVPSLNIKSAVDDNGSRQGLSNCRKLKYCNECKRERCGEKVCEAFRAP